MTHAPEKILVGVSGSIAALAVPGYLNALRLAGARQIVAVLTPAAEQFVAAGALRHLCDRVCTEQDHGPGHVQLGRWADTALVLPATADLIGCLAQGLAPNLLTTTLLAADSPVWLAPAMNPVMWRRPAVQRNVRRIEADGVRVIAPMEGPAWEVASRAVVPSLVIPPPEVIAGQVMSPQPAPEVVAAN